MIRGVIILLVSLLFVVGFRQIERRPPAGMITGYTFNGANANDFTGRGHNGTLTGGATATSGVVTLDGVNDYVAIADDDDLSVQVSGTDEAWTFAAWVNMDDATAFRIVSKDAAAGAGGQREYSLHTTGSDYLILLLIKDSDSANINRVSDNTLTAYEGTWIHLSAVYDGSESASGITLYVNGDSVASTAGSSGTYTGMEPTSAGVRIGSLQSASSFADGQIDDLLFFRRALTATEIRQLYEGGRQR